MMKKIKVISQGEILDSKCNLKDSIIISFHNTTDYNILEKQNVTFITNPDILTFKSNILFLKIDDVQDLTKFQFIKHSFKPYSNIFSEKDCVNIIEFLKEKDYKNKTLIFQCEYGKSRSLTTAMCLFEYFLNETHILEVDEKNIRNKVIEKIIIKYFKKVNKNV
jgi:hypothetical protein